MPSELANQGAQTGVCTLAYAKYCRTSRATHFGPESVPHSSADQLNVVFKYGSIYHDTYNHAQNPK